MCILLIIGIIIAIICIYFTPEFLSHFSWSCQITRLYKYENENEFRFIKYDHSKTDGVRLLFKLQNHKLPKIYKGPLIDSCQLWTRIQIKKPSNMSPFMFLISYFLKHCKSMQMNEILNTAIAVSTRQKMKNKYKEGCFVRTAYTQIDMFDSIEDISNKHKNSINLIQNTSRLTDTFAERSKLLNTHYFFNKWMLNEIERSDGTYLKLYKGGNYITFSNLLQLNYPFDMKCIPEKDNRWLILISPIWLTFTQ